jgi:hypothetical protein
VSGGSGSSYLVVGITHLYLGGLSLFHGNLPGWPIPPKTVEPVAAAGRSLYSGPALPPSYNPHPAGSYPGANYPGGNVPSITPLPGAYAGQYGNFPQNGMPLRAAGITPPPRPFGTPPSSRNVPANFPGTIPGSTPGPVRTDVPPTAGNSTMIPSAGGLPPRTAGQPGSASNNPAGSSNAGTPEVSAPAIAPAPAVSSSPVRVGKIGTPFPAHATTPKARTP